MEKKSNNYCIILAGGRGMRLWPSSRKDCPKQFVDFFGTGQTQLQSTFERINSIIEKDNIFICTNKEYEQLVKEQLPQVHADRILAEPVMRNTAPSVAWAGVRIHRECSDARVLIVPSDQFVTGEEAFRNNILNGLNFVSETDIILTMGIRPSRPEPGYGYIQLGEPSLFDSIHKVQSFTEKPERDFAKMFMESGEFLWNTGMFLANIEYLHKFFIDVIRDMPYRMADIRTMNMTEDEELQYVNQHYPSYPNLSMDKAALEMSDNVYVMTCDFGWADLGTWHSIYEFMQKGEEDNVIIDSEVIMEGCRGNIVKLPKGHVGVINGLDGYIVAEQGDVLLICKKGDSSSLIRKYVSEVGIRYGEKYS
jgi:mannose-1-phosphate guanylyltransferase